MADEPMVSNEQLEMMDDLDYIPAEDAGTNPDPDAPEVTQEVVEGEVKEPVVEAKPVIPVEEKKEPDAPVAPVVEDEKAKLLELYKEQLTHFQKRYEEEKKAREDLVKSQVPAAPQVTERKLPTQDQIMAHYAPEINATIDRGYMSGEFANSYPVEATQMLYHRDIIYGLVERVGQMVALLNQQHDKGLVSETEGMLAKLFDDTAKQGEFYSPLSEPEIREKFKSYLTELNPFVDQLTPEFVSSQWLAFNKEAILEAARLAASGQPAGPAPNIGGEVSGTRPRKPTAPQARPWDDL